MISDYIYPDIKDKLVNTFIEQYEVEEGGWEKEETSTLEIAEKYLRIFNGSNSSFLDAGCGNGRLIKVFEKYFSTVIAIDPDESRLKEAQENIKEFGIQTKTTTLRSSIEDFSFEHKFNTILCAYVLHIVSNAAAESIIKKLFNMLEEDGILLLLTSWSPEVYDKYSKAYFEKSRFVDKEINITEFEELIKAGKPNILPIHSFCTDHLKRVIDSNGFELVNIKPFHSTKIHNNPVDIMLVLRKPKKSPYTYSYNS